MKRKIISLVLSTLMFSAMFIGQSVLAQLTLTGTSYVQDFNSIASGLPDGWSVRTNATGTGLGTITANYNAAGNTWGDNPGEFRNCASTINNSGTNFLGSELSPIQSACTNRALAIHQTGTFGDAGAAFVLQITNTTGMSNFAFAVDLDMLKVNANSTTWTIQYGVGNSPTSFHTLGTYSDPGVFGATRQSYNLGADASNQSNLWIRIVALTATTDGGSRDTLGIDNFSLSWTTGGTSATSPLITGIAVANGQVQIDFTGASGDGPEAFVLQTACDACGQFVDAGIGAKIIQKTPGNFRATNSVTGTCQFYRIKRP